MNPDLPIAAIRRDLSTVLTEGNRVVLTAPTGSGKSTQVPQFLLADGLVDGDILMLQPRRLAARVLAERVADEMGESVGEVVGYRTRFEHCGGQRTRLWYVTDGMLPRQFLSDARLQGIGAVVFDEFHERSLVGDIGLALVARLQEQRPELKLVVMSATLDAEAVCDYLGGCAHLHAEGRLYDVAITYVDKPVGRDPWEAGARAAAQALGEGGDGDVLVFMPGVYEIRRTMEACRRLTAQVDVFPLFGDMAADLQHRVMSPGERRRIIVATNIAETSLTIPRVRHVVDSGLAKVNRYDHGRGVNMLECVPISRQAAEQRAGRAGREAPGTCRRLWTLAEQQRRPAALAAEVRRVDLAEAIVLLAALHAGDPTELAWFEAPASRAVDEAVALLRDLDVLAAESFELTDLGRAVSQIPAHPRLGRLLHDAHHAGCLNQAALAAAVLSERSILRPKQRYPERDGLQSDLLAMVEAVQAAQQRRFDVGFCESRGIHAGAARQVWRAGKHLLRTCRRLGWSLDDSGTDEAFGRCALAAFPDRLARRRDAGTLTCDLSNGVSAVLARESGCREAALLAAGEIREVSGRGRGSTTLLSMVTEVREEWLLELFPDEWVEEDETFWDERRRQVVRRVRSACLGVTLEQKEIPQVDAEKAADILADQVGGGRLILKGWTKEVDRWIDRVRWTAAVFPERGLLPYDETDIALIHRDICAGATSYRDIKNKPCLDLVRHAMNWDDIQFVETMAPPWIQLPSGWRMKIAYNPGQPPKGRARIQDLYDLDETPAVAGGRVPVLLDILEPNMRTVQITDDLPRFWREIYPRAKKRLAPRYTKHEWR